MVTGSHPPLANTVTSGVQDFSRQRDLCQRLGWPVVFESDGFTVVQLRGAVLALFQLGQLARDAHAQPGPIRAGIRSAVIITVDRPGDLDELASRARAAGATITKKPTDAEFFDGRDAYFRRSRRQRLGNRPGTRHQPGRRGGPPRRQPAPPPKTPPQCDRVRRRHGAYPFVLHGSGLLSGCSGRAELAVIARGQLTWPGGF